MGVSTRLIGALVMAHSDDQEWCCLQNWHPSRWWLCQFLKEPNKAIDWWKVISLMQELKKRYFGKVDDNDNNRPGGNSLNMKWKAFLWELQLRPRPCQQCMEVARRDTKEKKSYPIDGLEESIIALLMKCNVPLQQGQNFREQRITKADRWDDFVRLLDDNPGLLLHIGMEPGKRRRKSGLTKATIRLYTIKHSERKKVSVSCGKCQYPTRAVCKSILSTSKSRSEFYEGGWSDGDDTYCVSSN